MEPISGVLGGVCLTGVLAAVAWRKFHGTTPSTDTPQQATSPEKVVPFPPRISLGFSQGHAQHPKDLLIRSLNDAEKSLDIAIYAFTDLDIALELIKLHRRGVRVRIITDAAQTERNETQEKIMSELTSEGVLIRTNVQRDAFMHLKAVVIDGRTVTVGSFNFTNAAADKHEEMLVSVNDVTLAKDVVRHFDYMWNDRKRYALYKTDAPRVYA